MAAYSYFVLECVSSLRIGIVSSIQIVLLVASHYSVSVFCTEVIILSDILGHDDEVRMS